MPRVPFEMFIQIFITKLADGLKQKFNSYDLIVEFDPQSDTRIQMERLLTFFNYFFGMNPYFT